MQILQSLVSLVPFLQTEGDKAPISSHLAPGLSPPILSTCHLSSSPPTPLISNLTGGIDFSNPNVENILTGSGTANTDSSGKQSGGFPDLRRPVPGKAQQLRLHHKHRRHGASAALQTQTTCPDPPVLSCSTEADSTDACCVVRPGGALVHVQLWDLNIGQADSFGIHGLWPDKCTGEYYENCDSSRDYSASTISNSLPSALKSEMETYWLSNDESPQSFWAHEWSTHGTCVSTLEPTCFSGYTTGAEATLYFQTVVNLFKELDTYTALTMAGITPSNSATYSATDMQDAIESGTGYTPDLVCTDGELSSVQYYINALGPLQDGSFEQSSATRSSTCPSSIKWPPKTVSSSS